VTTTVPSHGTGPQPAITIHGVSKIYPGVDGTGLEALRNFSLDIHEGEFISLLGPSGCGKTTLMMIVAGLLPLTSGEVVLGGRSVDRPVTDAGGSYRFESVAPGRCSIELEPPRIGSAGRDEIKAFLRYQPRAVAARTGASPVAPAGS